MPEFIQRQHRTQSSYLVSPANPDRVAHQPARADNLLLASQQALGNQAVQHILHSKMMQAKLRVNEPGNRYEQEANRIADEVMQAPRPEILQGNTSSPPSFASIRPGLQRKCACGGTPGPTGECAACRAKRLGLQRFAVSHAQTAAVPPIVHDVLRSPGQLLDDSTRASMEPHFGHDFSKVRVHTDAKAAESARAVNAQAYTVGRDIVFGMGQYAPGTTSGRQLLAHELVHTVQQTGVGIENDKRPSHLQRKIGDDHDLRSDRFAGDLVLEACFDNERLLKVGDTGDAVAKIQQALVDAGFPLPQFGVDGEFGNETKTAVENFQRESGLTGPDVDGIIGPITMGLLDARFLAAPPQPTVQCPDQTVNTDKDPLPPVPPFNFSIMSAPEVLEKVKQLQPPGHPIPKSPPLGAFQPTFDRKPVAVKALPVAGSTCVKCVADWDLSARVAAFIAAGSFTNEPKRFPAIQQGDTSGCPSKPIPDLLEVRKLILPEAIPFIVAGEFEHYLDFVRAFRIAGGRYLANVRRLTAERTHLRAKDQKECEDKIEKFLLLTTGLPGFPLGGSFLNSFADEFRDNYIVFFNSADRDESGSHTARAHPPDDKLPIFPNIDLDKNPFGCNAFCRKFNAKSFPGIPGESSETLIKDTAKSIFPLPKQVWHVL